jgi:undecaprenyl phosphate-alpha-L-ara4FN deformylase
MTHVVAIKVDVDTYEGMRHGVPTLLALFKKYGIMASFFVPMGKDHTGWTAKRVFTRKGFLEKAGRVGVIDTYGIKTLMYGLLLPGPQIAKKNADGCRAVEGEGHELGIHGLDHVWWHDHIKHLEREKTEAILEKAFETYQGIMGHPTRSFASPGWMINSHALRVFEESGLAYSSDTRGTSPFFPELGGEQFNILQIPTTLPTLDEVVGIAGTEVAQLAEFYLGRLRDGLNILTVHTELEGKNWAVFLDTLIRRMLEAGSTFKRLVDVAVEYENVIFAPRCEITYGRIEGRAGEVSLQSASCDDESSL